MAQPRRPFQFHLSTAILLMFAVGGVLAANLIPYDSVSKSISDSGEITEIHYSNCNGWPFAWGCNKYTTSYGNPNRGMSMACGSFGCGLFGMGVNLISQAALIFGIYCASKWWIRRSEARKKV